MCIRDSNKGFKTIECPDNIGEIIDQYNFFSSTVLFECMSNYLANKMFGEDNIISNNILSEIISCLLYTSSCFIKWYGQDYEEKNIL